MKTKAFSFFNSDVATRFENNFRELRLNNRGSVLEFLHRLGSDPSMISCAFAWKDTPEGTGYWKTISLLWKRFLKGEGESLSEDLDINSLDAEELKLLERFETVIETRLKPRQLKPKDILEEFRSLFGGKVYESFKRNFETDSDLYRESQNLLAFLKDQIDMSKVGNMVDVAFVWCGTPEGPEYWKRIHETWKTYWRTKAGVQED